MLPTVKQVHVARGSFPHWRVDAPTQRHQPPVRCGDDVRVQAAAAIQSAQSIDVLPLRARKAVVHADNVRDGP